MRRVVCVLSTIGYQSTRIHTYHHPCPTYSVYPCPQPALSSIVASVVVFIILVSFFFNNYLILNERKKRLILWEELYVYWIWQDIRWKGHILILCLRLLSSVTICTEMPYLFCRRLRPFFFSLCSIINRQLHFTGREPFWIFFLTINLYHWVDLKFSNSFSSSFSSCDAVCWRRQHHHIIFCK